MKYLTRAFGVAAIIIALYIMVGEQLVGTSADAHINAPIVTIRTPISGELDMAPLPLGARVTPGQMLANVAARSGQTDRTLDYARDLAVAVAERDALSNRRAEAEGVEWGYELTRLDARIEALEALLADQQAAQTPQVSANIASPTAGVVWSAPEPDGTQLSAGTPIATLAQCDMAIVYATVDERLYNRLTIGDRAQFRASNGTTYEATVILLGGTGPRTLIETFAIEPSARQRDGYSVILRARGLAAQGACPLGRTGRVIFSRGPLSVLGEWFNL